MNSVFARRQLEKHGWTDGDGLGRRKNGMSQPIKVNLKMDKTGVGHDPGKEFTDHWWMRAFNDAAKKTKKADEPKQTEESKRKAEMSAKRKNFYKGFVKGSTLTNGCETKDSDQSNDEDEDDEEKDKASLPTLDDLHKFCDGATGHRAARFGIKMKGKLSRVAAHDKEFEEQKKIDPGILYVKKGKHNSSAKVSSSDTKAINLDENVEISPSTSDKNQFTDKVSHEVDEALLVSVAFSETEKKRKKKRKREKDDKELESAVERKVCSLASESELNEEIGKKKKKTDSLVEEATMRNGKSKKKKKRKTDSLVEVEEATMRNSKSNSDDTDNSNGEIDKQGNLHSEILNELVCQEQPGTKKRKKRKTDTLVEEAAMSKSNSNDTDNSNREIHGQGNLISDITNELVCQEQPGTKKKKKRKTDTLVEVAAMSKSNSDSTDNNNSNREIDEHGKLNTDIPHEPVCQEQSRTKKKKKRKTVEEVDMNKSHNNDSTGISSREIENENLNSIIFDEPATASEEQERTKKKKKRKSNTSVEDVAMNVSDSTGNRKIDDGKFESDVPNEPESQELRGTKRKKKRKSNA